MTAVRKKIVLATISAALSFPAFGMSGTTNDGYVACLSEALLDDVTKFVTANDKASLQAYLDSKKCIIIKGGLKVTVTESPGMFGGKTGFVFQGLKLWTYREAINYGE